MKSMWLAFLATAVIAVAADYGLDQTGWSSADRNSGTAVRLQ